MRRRFVQRNGELIEVTNDYQAEPRAPLVFGDTPGYQSPVTGLWVDGRVQRKEDLKRSGCRPWEGLDQEKKEAARHQTYAAERQEAALTKSVSEAFYQLSPTKRAILRRA